MSPTAAASKPPASPLTLSQKLRSVALLPYGDRHLVLGVLAVTVGLKDAIFVLAVWNLAAALLQAMRRFDRSAAGGSVAARNDLYGDGYLGSALARRAVLRLPMFVALAIASIPVWLPHATSWHPAHLLLPFGLLLTAQATPAWTGPLATYLFELGTILILANSGASPELAAAAITAVTLLRHAVNSDLLTDGHDRGWRWDPLGWEVRSVGWLCAAFFAPAVGVLVVIYTSAAVVWRLVANLAERLRLDRSMHGLPSQ